MKILHLIDSGGLYGAEAVLLNLVEQQRARGDESLILSAGTPDCGEKPLEQAARERGLPVRPWRMRAGLNLPAAWSILRFARGAGFEVLHSHGYKFNILMGMWPRFLRGAPLVSTLHGYTNTGRLDAMWIYERLDRWMLGRCQRVVVSPAMRALPALSALELVEIPNGIPLPDESCAQAPRLDQHTEDFLAAHAPCIGAVGRLSPEKGLLDLVDAFASLRERHLHAGLLLIGEGRQRGEIESRIRQRGLAGHVHLAGFRTPVSGYMRRCTLIALPSYTEGLPITLLEAMALGIPMVASRVGAVPAVLGNGEFGALVEPGEPAGLCEALAAALADPAAATRRAAAARGQVAARYSAAAMTDAYARLYAQTLSTQAPVQAAAGRIHILMDFLANPHAGTESQAIKLMRGLSERGWQVDAAFFNSSTYLESGALPVPWAVLGIRRMGSPATWFRLARHALHLRRRGVRLVHIFFNDASLVAPPVLKLFGIRVIISRRDMGFWYTPKLKRLLRLSGRCVDRVVCNSEAVRELTAQAERIPLARIEVVHNGYESPALVERPVTTVAGPVVGIVANLRPIKRIDDLVAAFAGVVRRHPQAELRVIGAGDAEPLRAKARALGIEPRVQFMGARSDAAAMVRDFDVAVLCSESEGLSNAIIEYLQAARPVVCTRTGGNPEIVEDGVNGYLVEVGDTSALAERILRLLDDPVQARQMGERGAERARQRFSIQAMIAAHERLYRLLGGRHAG